MLVLDTEKSEVRDVKKLFFSNMILNSSRCECTLNLKSFKSNSSQVLHFWGPGPSKSQVLES